MVRGNGTEFLDLAKCPLKPPPGTPLPHIPERATPDQKASFIPELERIIAEQREIIRAQHDIIVSQQVLSVTVPGSGLQSLAQQVRAHWAKLVLSQRTARIALAVFQGLLESSLQRELTSRQWGFFQRTFERIEQARADASALENEACGYGLPVCDPDEQVVAMAANFGFVEEITGQQIRVVLLEDDDRQEKCQATVPAVWLPHGWRREGAGIAWVERHYTLGVKGRFEPASAGNGDG